MILTYIQKVPKSKLQKLLSKRGGVVITTLSLYAISFGGALESFCVEDDAKH